MQEFTFYYRNFRGRTYKAPECRRGTSPPASSPHLHRQKFAPPFSKPWLRACLVFVFRVFYAPEAALCEDLECALAILHNVLPTIMKYSCTLQTFSFNLQIFHSGGVLYSVVAEYPEETSFVRYGDHQPNSHEFKTGYLTLVADVRCACTNHCANRTDTAAFKNTS
ncbi:hypothetical protein DPMN_021848 [Dreissena polymorpha]|uniref:Uncharacterized protein n=1 Tax=Dreissena polymorpha TaxID=45954 RepID=A0A9D4NNE1_DREPO|nr:hypothetical protein DPMN_021848 [Dreissena polymorpha]